MHGGAKFYRGSPTAARSYVEADRTRVDDYYLAEDTGLATHYRATNPTTGLTAGHASVEVAGMLDGDTYERWVAGIDVVTSAAKGRLRSDDRAQGSHLDVHWARIGHDGTHKGPLTSVLGH